MGIKSFIIKPMVLATIVLTSAFTAGAYTINGTLADVNGESLPDATIRLLQAKDSAFVKGTIADIDGNFALTGVKNGKYIVEASYIGFNTEKINTTVKSTDVNLGKITLQEYAHELGEATVTAVKTPVKVMQDTIEYNADSYKTQANAVVEDLLKRLPGVDVDSDGKITANGKEVTKILIDGKEFFSDDPKVASKNLPVNMVDKLQVVDRKSELARLTGVDDGEDETVINLTVKRGMQDGWFGTVEAGYGTDSRYKGTFNVNRFWNGNQLTFIGNANNTNELGFTDGNGQRFRRFGGDQGINNAQNFGVNFNIGNEEIFRVGGDVMYSHTDRKSITRRLRQYLLQENSYDESSNSDARDRGNN
ncbi:MAG: carboxypeptidase-like regulatory domain-containing protein, partial [Muribaculaceae bacterium]|nr:carboxypeptidase-like regulatory domain-containing protein [Muribaculaceae bacterium]